jgi:hypothetical protein
VKHARRLIAAEEDQGGDDDDQRDDRDANEPAGRLMLRRGIAPRCPLVCVGDNTEGDRKYE